MIIQVNDGDRIPVPCRHCASLSTEVAVASGTRDARCGRCDRTTRVRMVKAESGWSITTEDVAAVAP